MQFDDRSFIPKGVPSLPGQDLSPSRGAQPGIQPDLKDSIFTPAQAVLLGLELALPTAKEIAGGPFAQVAIRLESAFNRLTNYLDDSRDRMPPLRFHGTTHEGLEGLVRDRAPNGDKMWFAEVLNQAPDTRIYANDLLNIALKANEYATSYEGSNAVDGGVVMFTGESPAHSTERYRRWLDDERGLLKQFGRGAFSERHYADFTGADFEKHVLGGVDWAASQYSMGSFEAMLNPADPVSFQRRELFTRARALELIATAIDLLDLNSRPAGAFRPAQVTELQHGDLILKRQEQNATVHTYPDGFEVIVGRDGISGRQQPQGFGSSR